jgi:hypothetical protein
MILNLCITFHLFQAEMIDSTKCRIMQQLEDICGTTFVYSKNIMATLIIELEDAHMYIHNQKLHFNIVQK